MYESMRACCKIQYGRDLSDEILRLEEIVLIAENRADNSARVHSLKHERIP